MRKDARDWQCLGDREYTILVSSLFCVSKSPLQDNPMQFYSLNYRLCDSQLCCAVGAWPMGSRGRADSGCFAAPAPPVQSPTATGLTVVQAAWVVTAEEAPSVGCGRPKGLGTCSMAWIQAPGAIAQQLDAAIQHQLNEITLQVRSIRSCPPREPLAVDDYALCVCPVFHRCGV